MNEHKSSAGKGGMGFLGVLQIVFHCFETLQAD